MFACTEQILYTFGMIIVCMCLCETDGGVICIPPRHVQKRNDLYSEVDSPLKNLAVAIDSDGK